MANVSQHFWTPCQLSICLFFIFQSPFIHFLHTVSFSRLVFSLFFTVRFFTIIFKNNLALYNSGCAMPFLLEIFIRENLMLRSFPLYVLHHFETQFAPSCFCHSPFLITSPTWDNCFEVCSFFGTFSVFVRRLMQNTWTAVTTVCPAVDRKTRDTYTNTPRRNPYPLVTVPAVWPKLPRSWLPGRPGWPGQPFLHSLHCSLINYSQPTDSTARHWVPALSS